MLSTFHCRPAKISTRKSPKYGGMLTNHDYLSPNSKSGNSDQAASHDNARLSASRQRLRSRFPNCSRPECVHASVGRGAWSARDPEPARKLRLPHRQTPDGLLGRLRRLSNQWPSQSQTGARHPSPSRVPETSRFGQANSTRRLVVAPARNLRYRSWTPDWSRTRQEMTLI